MSPSQLTTAQLANAQTQMSIAGETAYNYKYIVMPLRI